MRLIDADVLRDRMCRQCNVEMSDEPCEPDDCFVRLVIMDMPTIDPESLRPQGEWSCNEIYLNLPSLNGYCCSNCYQHQGRQSNYCPNCGARMTGKEEISMDNKYYYVVEDNDFCSEGERREDDG